MVTFNEKELAEVNAKLEGKSPVEILRWARENLSNLYQTSALGLTGLVIVDLISKLQLNVPLIFIDTLHHFNETYELLDQVRARFPHTEVVVVRPSEVTTEQEFAKKYGEKLWDTNDLFYDYLVKVEPSTKAYEKHNVEAVITGRRRSQGHDRADLPIIERDETGMLKVNPLVNWSFDEVQHYIKDNRLPYNKLVDQGYRSIGDYHSTVPLGDGEDERSGRWRGKSKTECGLHLPELYKQFASKS